MKKHFVTFLSPGTFDVLGDMLSKDMLDVVESALRQTAEEVRQELEAEDYRAARDACTVEAERWRENMEQPHAAAEWQKTADRFDTVYQRVRNMPLPAAPKENEK